MHFATVRRVAVVALAFLCAYILSRIIVTLTLSVLGISGVPAFLGGLILFAVAFFGILHLMERYAGLQVFRFGPD